LLAFAPFTQSTNDSTLIARVIKHYSGAKHVLHSRNADPNPFFTSRSDFSATESESRGGGVGLAGGRYSIHDVTIDDVDTSAYQGTGTLFLLANGWPANVLHSIAINHVTGFPDSDKHLFTLLNDLSNPDMTDLSFTNNLVLAARYPVWSAGGGSTNCAYYNIPSKSVPKCFSTYSFKGNGIIAASSAFPPSLWPTGNYFPIDAGAVEFANFASGDYRLLNGSRYKNAGTDGRDLGADINALNSATLGVK